jgi:hypothetical protein
MKIYLVTMKGLPDNNVNERMKCMALEAEWEARNAGRIEFSPIEVMEAVTAPGEELPDTEPVDPDPRPKRAYNWLAAADDERYIRQWREALKERRELLEKVGISISPDRAPKEDDTEYQKARHLNNPTFACVGEQLLQILEVDDSVTVKSAAPVASDTHEGALARLVHVIEKLEKMEIPEPVAAQGHIYNEHVTVHTPGNMLATYNETLLLEDACTDELQKSLDNGWRIVAACPQAQRRPDYILGRYNPEYDSGNGAKRKP